jgi:hypothetical protein
MTSYPINNSNLTDLADASRLDDIMRYARRCATEIIHAAFTIDRTRIAQSISSDALESASYSTLPIDPQLLFAFICAIICDRLDCDDSDIAADF